MTTIVYFPYYMFGRFDQKQTITLTLKDNYVDNAVKSNSSILMSSWSSNTSILIVHAGQSNHSKSTRQATILLG